MNSIEKLARFQAELQAAQPADEAQARMAQLATLVGPFVGSMLPDDPALVDQYLAQLAAWSLQQRSDDAVPAAIVVKGEDGEWAALPSARTEPEAPEPEAPDA